MTITRAKQVDPAQPAWSHCITRCVRRARLCGFDPDTGASFEHRTQWAKGRIALLAELSAVDVAAHAVMGNPLHVVVHTELVHPDEWAEPRPATRKHATSAFDPAPRQAKDPPR